ncbi:unnamed protein product, partial [Scytosiphon promiscuus]
GGTDIVITKLDANLGQEEGTQLGGDGDDIVTAIAFDEPTLIVIVG